MDEVDVSEYNRRMKLTDYGLEVRIVRRWHEPLPIGKIFMESSKYYQNQHRIDDAHTLSRSKRGTKWHSFTT
jgi:hypothetical protein